MTSGPRTDGHLFRDLLFRTVNAQCDTFSYLVRTATRLGLAPHDRKQLGYEMRCRHHLLIDESIGPPARIGNVDLESASVDRDALRALLEKIIDLEDQNLDLLMAVNAKAGGKPLHDPEDLRILVENRRSLLDRAFADSG